MYKQLQELVIQYVDINPESITSDSRFVEDLGFDSLDFIAMIGDMEEQFHMEVDSQAAMEIKTVGDAARCIGAACGQPERLIKEAVTSL